MFLCWLSKLAEVDGEYGPIAFGRPYGKFRVIDIIIYEIKDINYNKPIKYK